MSKRILRAAAIGMSLAMITCCGCGKKSIENGTPTGNSQKGTYYDENNNQEIQDSEMAVVDKFDVTVEYSEEEMVTTYKADDIFEEDGTLKDESTSANTIIFSEASVKKTGAGISVDGTTVRIAAAGTYYISGKSSNGQIVVDCNDKGTVILVLNNLELTCTKSAPIYCSQVGTLIINLPKNTTTTLTDGENYEGQNENSEPNSAVYCDDDLTINGEGKLIVKGNYNNGIVAKDILKIMSGEIQVEAVNNGIKGKDGVVVSGGNIKINASGDGIKADNSKDTTKGYILLETGNIDITAGEDGIVAHTCMKITGGDIKIYTGSGSNVTSMDNGWGNKRPMGQTTTTTTESVSKKGMKAGTDITITGGTINIESEDDSIHTNSTILIDGGSINVKAGDDGIHSDTELSINGGTIVVEKSYEGIESTTININGGDISATATDDGINAAGGDGSSMGGRPGMNQFSGASGLVTITGGKLYINAAGDGLDSNGNINMTGGIVMIDGPTNSGNGALDYDGQFAMSGGVIYSAGSSGMLQSPSCSGDIYGVTIVFNGSQSSGSTISIKDITGNVVATFSPAKSYNSFVYASAELKKDGKYEIYIDDTKYDEFTVSSSNTSVGSGGGNMGGRPGGNNSGYDNVPGENGDFGGNRRPGRPQW